jgi:hypothetical protein
MEGNRPMGTKAQSETESKVKQTAEEVRDKAASVAEEATQKAKEQTRSTIATQKEEAVHELHGVAEAFRMTGSQLREQDQTMVAGYSNKIADQVDRISNYLDQRNLDEVIVEAEDFARRKPEIFLGGAFTLGLLASRFFKSSAPPHPGDVVRYSPEQRPGPAVTSFSYTDQYGRSTDDTPQWDEPETWNERIG